MLDIGGIKCSLSAESTEPGLPMVIMIAWIGFLDHFVDLWVDTDWIPTFDILVQKEQTKYTRKYIATCTLNL